MEEGCLTRFKIGDILQPRSESRSHDDSDNDYYWLVKRVGGSLYDLYDVENLRSGKKLFSMRMELYEKIP
jgi:hypothetical protein